MYVIIQKVQHWLQYEKAILPENISNWLYQEDSII